MRRAFDYFIILAGMRTGSNFLETSLNQLGDVEVLGEAFNPVFVGHQKQQELLGFDLKTRERAPLDLIEKLSRMDGKIAGFRFFHDHDPRVLKHCLADKRCAKIVLNRDPLDSFVSLQIARTTGQWKLTDGKGRKSARIHFDPKPYAEFCASRDAFQQLIRTKLQKSGQAGFDISYPELADVDVLNGLAAYLGSDETMKAPSRTLKQQNPGDMREKVVNFDEMTALLKQPAGLGVGQIDPEPSRGPSVPAFVVSDPLKLIFAPLRSGPTAEVAASLTAVGETRTGLTQTDLRAWKRDTEGHRSFTVLRHPLPRAFAVYQEYFVTDHPDYRDLKVRLSNHQKVTVPSDGDQSTEALRDGFESFLRFLKANLSGDTSIPIDPIWASQTVLLDGIANVLHPDFVLREDQLADGLRNLGVKELVQSKTDTNFAALGDIYSERVEKLCRSAYRKDYINFGFSSWT